MSQTLHIIGLLLLGFSAGLFVGPVLFANWLPKHGSKGMASRLSNVFFASAALGLALLLLP